MDINEMDAKQVIAHLDMMFDWKRRPHEGKFLQRAFDLLNEQEQIVRCKDCKHWVPGYITDEDEFIPPRCLDNHGVGWSANDFCSYGVKK